MGMTKNSMGLAVLAAMFSPATASLRACSDIGCNPVCEVNNEVLSSVGTTKFISAAYASEMEWTVGIVNATSPLRKNYYLASMPGLSLSNATGLGGCALIFNGIESKLKFANATGYEYDNGQCSDALKANCESDLLRQARVMAANMTSSGALRCGDLAQSLQNNPPKSCEIGTNWGTITAKALTGPDFPANGVDRKCAPFQNKDNVLRFVASTTVNGTQDHFKGVTPLLTVFAPYLDSSEFGTEKGPLIARPEAQLSCMKPIANAVPENAKPTNGASALSVHPALVSAMACVMGTMFALA